MGDPEDSPLDSPMDDRPVSHLGRPKGRSEGRSGGQPGGHPPGRPGASPGLAPHLPLFDGLLKLITSSYGDGLAQFASATSVHRISQLRAIGDAELRLEVYSGAREDSGAEREAPVARTGIADEESPMTIAR